MYKYLVAIVLLTPLIGIWLVERGEFAATVGIDGHENGASVAFACYVLAIAVVAWACRGRLPNACLVPRERPGVDRMLHTYAGNLIVVNAFCLVVFLFGFGAIDVWTGSVGKGEFRAGLGPLGALPTLLTKFVLPALLAYAAVLYRASSRSPRATRLLAANIALLFVIGASWGFKATAFTVLMPALLILYWRVGVWTLIKLSAVFIVTIFSFFFVFDTGIAESADAQTFLFRRVTVLQGDVAWFIWGEYASGQVFPDYLPTLLAAIGDKFLTLAGLSRDDYSTWLLYHYDLMITYLAGSPLEQIEEGHSITATPFAEGLVAAGIPGVALFAAIAGLLVGRLHHYIQHALVRGHDARAAIASTYFCMMVFPWLNGGAVVQLFHISVWFALFVTVFALHLMRRFVPIRLSSPAPALA